jgi:hypothetical protein
MQVLKQEGRGRGLTGEGLPTVGSIHGGGKPIWGQREIQASWWAIEYGDGC